MEESGEVVRKGIKRRYKVIGIVVLILAVVFAVSIIHGKNQLEKKLDEVRAAGFPVTLAELDAWYSIPKGVENAADIYMQAFEVYTEPESKDVLPVVGYLDELKRGESMKPETIKAIEKYLADNKETLELLGQAGKIDHCRYPDDLSQGLLNFQTSYLSNFKQCSMLLCLKVMYQAQSGNGQLAADDIDVSLSLSRSIENHPTLINQLVRLACTAISVGSAEYAVNMHQFNDEQLAGMIQRFIQAEKTDLMARAAAGERPLFIDYMLNPGNYPGMVTVKRTMPMSLYSITGLKNSGLIEYVDLTSENIAALRLPLHERDAALKLVEEKMFDLPWYHMIIKINSSPVKKVSQLDLRLIGDLRACWTGLAVERYRLAEGKLPESLDQLVPRFIKSIPLDPFDGKQIRYKKINKGYVVYSVGEDGVDNGGRERTPENRKEQHDWTFIVERDN